MLMKLVNPYLNKAIPLAPPFIALAASWLNADMDNLVKSSSLL